MIQITNMSNCDMKRLERLMRSFNTGKYQFNREVLTKDIKRITLEMNKERNPVKKQAKEGVLSYLRDVLLYGLNRYDRCTVRWYTDEEGTMWTEPLPLISIGWCGIDITKYMMFSGGSNVEICYRDLWDAIALAIAHNDLGYGIEEIEKQLYNCNIMAVLSSNSLKPMLDNTIYNDVNIMRIGECEYVNDEGVAVDFFGNEVKEAGYKEILNSSVKRLMALILNGILRELKKGDGRVEFIGCFGSTVYFNTDLSRDDIIKMLGQSVVLKIFGRNFEFMPALRITEGV